MNPMNPENTMEFQRRGLLRRKEWIRRRNPILRKKPGTRPRRKEKTL
jgi:hypothetical protein